MDAWRDGHCRCEWQEGQSHWVRRRDGGFARRKRGWSIGGVVGCGIGFFFRSGGRETLRVGHFDGPRVRLSCRPL